jgi:hypothetical protein
MMDCSTSMTGVGTADSDFSFVLSWLLSLGKMVQYWCSIGRNVYIVFLSSGCGMLLRIVILYVDYNVESVIKSL